MAQREVRIWFTRTEPLIGDPLLERYQAVLSADERVRYDAFVFDLDRHEYLVAHALLRWALSLATGLAPSDLSFRTGQYGKPELANPLPSVPLFSLTHTRGLVACAIASLPVGIDVESLTRNPDPELARRFFSRPEVDWLDTLPTAQRQRAFLRLWTLKESYIKGTGLGLHQPLNAFWFDLAGSEPRLCLNQTMDEQDDCWRFLLDESRTDEHVLAVAVHASRETPVQFTVEEAIPFNEH